MYHRYNEIYSIRVLGLSRIITLFHRIILRHVKVTVTRQNLVFTTVTEELVEPRHATINRGIKHDFPFINIRKVPREVLKTEGEARGFQPSRGTLRMLMNDKIMFDRYYCINSTKHCENEENIGALYFITSPHFPTRVRYARFGPRSSTHNIARALRDAW